MTSTLKRWATLALLAGGAQGCVATTPDWDNRFGNATRTNLAVQTIDPAASTNRNPALGLDGPAARAAIDNYQRAFARPETGQPAALIGKH
jgi:hypothetical protein